MAKDLIPFPGKDVRQVSLADGGGSTQPQKKSAKEIMAAANEQRRIDSGQKSAKEIMAAANQQRLVDDAGRVDGAYISSFFQDAQSFLNQSQADLEGMSWASSRDQAAQANRNAQFSDLDYRAKVIGSFLENNKAGMDENAYKELTAGLDSYNSLSSEAREYFDTLGQYYANFDSQEAFDADQRKGGYFQTYSGKTDEELAAALEGLEKGSNTQVTQLQAQKETLLQQGRDRLAAGAPEDEVRKLLEQAAQIDRQLQQAQSLAKDEESAWLNDYIAYRAYLQDEAWRSKYAGKSYKELMAILEKMDGSTKEAAWLEAYAPEAMTLKEAEIMYKSTTGKEQLFYTQLYNSKLMDQKIQILSKAKMPRGRTTVLEELQNIVDNNGNVSESKKDAVKAQMRKAGVDPDEWYGLLTGDGNVNAGDLVDWAGASLQSGLGSFNKSVTSTLDVLIGKPLQALGWKNNPISSAAEHYSDQYDIQAYNRQLYKDKMGGGKGFDIAESLLESTVAAVPDALLAYMTAGASTTASSAKLASNAAYQGGNILTKAGITAKNMASNPGFWTSFGRSYGSDYEEAKAMGASDTTAALCATITSLLNSSIEIGLSGNSGIQGLPQEIAEGGSKKMLAWLISSAEEGGEEVLQGFVNDLVARVSYDRSREIADLGKMAEEFGLGAGVGLILGGGQSVAASTVNAYTNREQNKKIKERYGSSVEELIQEGLEAPEGSLSHSLAMQYQQRVNNGKELSGGEIAKLIAANEDESWAKLGRIYDGSVEELIQEGLASAYGSQSHILALRYRQRLDRGEELSGREIAKLIAANEDAFRAEVSQEQKTPPAATPGAEAVNDTAQQVQPQAQPQIQEQVQPLEQQISVEAAPMSAQEAFQAEVNRQLAGGNVSDLDTEALAEGVRARAAEALDSGEINQEDYRMAMDELEQMDLEAEGRAYARANQEAQVETVWRKLGRKLGLVNENGGNANGTANYEWQSEEARSYLYAGGGQRNAGTGAGGQAASMAEGPGVPQPRADTGAEAAGSADSSQSIRVSGQSLGVSRSTGEASIRMIPPQAWTDEQIALAQEIQEKTGKQAVFILDTIPIRKTDGGLRQARGAFTGEQVIVQVNNREADAEQVAAHEIYHAQNSYMDEELNEEVKANIIKRFSKEEFEAVVAVYVKALEGVYDVGTGVSEAMNQAALELIEEDVLADAYAGINAFGANAGRFGWAVWEKTDELGLGYPGKEMSRQLGSGPPVERYSFDDSYQGADEARVAYFEDMDTQRKQQYVEGIREAESDARLEYFEQQAELQPGEDADPEQVAREVEAMRRRSEPKPEPAEAEPVTPIAREDLPAKARDNLAREEAAALRGLRKSFGVTQTNAREFLKETVQQISDEYLATGKISQETADRLFEDAWKKGEIEDREFYDQYEHIKEKLRTTAVTLDKRDQADIADFRDFKSRSRYMLKITNEGGMPVDSLYEELRGMAPELFPESITHPADQLVRMYEAAKSIVIRKAGLDQYYGAESANMKQYARENFDEAMSGFERKLWAVRRFGSDKAAQAEQKTQKPKVRTLEEALEAGNKMKDARRASERAVAKNLLTASDEEIVGKLLRGEMSLAQLDPSRDNVEGIRAVYEAKRAYEEAVKPVAEYKRLVHAQLRSKADGFLDTANSWKDKKSGLAYSRETMTRNIYDIVPDKALAKRILQEYFEPVQIAEAARTRFKTEMRDRVRAMKLSRNVAKGNIVSEAAAVQILGEAQDNMESLKRTQAYIKTRDGKTLDEWGAVIENLWLNNPKLDKGKIQRGVEEFRKIYDELFTKMNEARVRFGYEPVSYRKGYFPHFQPDGGDGIMAFFGKALGIDTQVDVLPTTINGLTHTFRPGTTWFGNAQERLGFNTVYDAVEGFDRYIEGVSDVIYHTENIQNLRALASQMRYRSSDEGMRKQADEIMADSKLSDHDKELRLKELYENGKYALSNFVNELEEYTNLLANKKSRLDRAAEMLIGRGRLYRGMRWVNSRVAANMVGGNVSSAMTNFIPVVQAAGRVGDKNILLGMWDTMRGAKDGITEKSDFLASRRGSDVLVKTRVQKASEFVGGLMNIVDNFTSGTIVRAAYYKNLESGMSEAEALHEADVFAAGVMAGRAKGDMPTLFHSVNPLIKMFTQFQLEVNNQYSEVFKDMPRQHRGQAAYKFAMAILGYFVRAYLFNELFELLFGRRSALDPINLLNEFVGDATGYEIPSLSSIVAGEASFKTDKKKIGDALTTLGKSAAGELPFAAGLTFVGFETDGGRIPVSSAIPDFSVFFDILGNDSWAPEYKLKKAQDELNKLAYVIPPFAGGQIAKTWKGLKAYMQGGSYGMDSKGNELLQYPIYKDSPIEALGNALRTAVMGKSSVPEAVEWVEDGFDSFGSKQTAMYKDMLDAGVKARDAYELIDALRSAEETDSKAKKDVQLEMIRSSKISAEAKAIAVYGFIDSDSLEDVMDLLDDAGVDAGTILDVVYGYREAQLLEKGTKAAQQQVILDADLTDSEKLLLVGELIGTDMETAAGKPTEYAKLLEAMDEGMSVDDYLKLVQAEGDIDDYLEYTEAGLSNEQALRVVDALEDLEPEAGEDSVSDMQKWREIADMPFDDDVKSMALEGMMSDSQYEKYSLALAADVSTYQYINFLEAASGLTSDKDKNGKTISGSLKNKVVDLIHSMPLTPSQKDALYLSKGYAQSGLKDTPWH